MKDGELVVHAEGEGEDVAVLERGGSRDLLLVHLDAVSGAVLDGDDVGGIGVFGLGARDDAVLGAHWWDGKWGRMGVRYGRWVVGSRSGFGRGGCHHLNVEGVLTRGDARRNTHRTACR